MRIPIGQRDAMERAMPREVDVENKMEVNSKILPAIKDWKTGESYDIKNMKIVQISSDEMTDGTIKAEFEIVKITV